MFNHYNVSSDELERALDILQFISTPQEFINSVPQIIEDDPERVISILHHYGLGDKILNNIACDSHDFFKICYPEIDLEPIPINIDKLGEFKDKYEIEEWDYPTDEINHVLSLENEHINSLALVTDSDDKTRMRLVEIPEHSLARFLSFVSEVGLTDLDLPYSKKLYTLDPYHYEMVDFLSDHPLIEMSVKNHFSKELSEISEKELKNWFLSHPKQWNNLQDFLIKSHPDEKVFEQNFLDYELSNKNKKIK